MKSFTSLEQSKKLAEFLPLESADMRYLPSISEVPFIWSVKQMQESEAIPAWSLSALLNMLPKIVNNETLFVETSPSLWHIGYRNVYIARASKLVDACYELVIKLNELKML